MKLLFFSLLVVVLYSCNIPKYADNSKQLYSTTSYKATPVNGAHKIYIGEVIAKYGLYTNTFSAIPEKRIDKHYAGQPFKYDIGNYYPIKYELDIGGQKRYFVSNSASYKSKSTQSTDYGIVINESGEFVDYVSHYKNSDGSYNFISQLDITQPYYSTDDIKFKIKSFEESVEGTTTVELIYGGLDKGDVVVHLIKSTTSNEGDIEELQNLRFLIPENEFSDVQLDWINIRIIEATATQLEYVIR